MGLRDAPAGLELAHIPRLLRDREAPASATSTATTAPPSSSSSIRSTSGDGVVSRSTSGVGTDDAELSMTASLEVQWAKRKSQFYAHFKSLSDGDKSVSADVGPETAAVNLSATATAAAHADSKCHVCNAALRLLRLRVSSCTHECI